MHVCMYVCMYVRMYVKDQHICICICICEGSTANTAFVLFTSSSGIGPCCGGGGFKPMHRVSGSVH